MSPEVWKEMAIKNPWLEQWDNNPLYRLQFNLNCGVLNSIVGLNKSRSKTLFFKLHTEYVTLIFFFSCSGTGFGFLFECLELSKQMNWFLETDKFNTLT